jgi:hypothetical protein
VRRPSPASKDQFANQTYSCNICGKQWSGKPGFKKAIAHAAGKTIVNGKLQCPKD